MKVNLTINGINVVDIEKDTQAFYDVFGHKVELNICFRGEQEISSFEPEYIGFKSLEPELTERYGLNYCQKHSRKIHRTCDICDLIRVEFPNKKEL